MKIEMQKNCHSTVDKSLSVTYRMQKTLANWYPKHAWQRKHWRIEKEIKVNKRLADKTLANWSTVAKFARVFNLTVNPDLNPHT